jgi:glycosyltransferase involved in cell wall biosynthesis
LIQNQTNIPTRQMANQASPRIICLSNVFEQRYHDLRGEKIDRCLSWAKRRDLYRCLEMATGFEVLVLSSPPRASERRSPKWLPPVETTFSTHRQLFCGNWDVPKLRVPLSWFFYARHVLRHTCSGDLVLLDNYELIYVIAARLLKMFRRVKFLLDYEDGKHLIERGWPRVLGRLAEDSGRPLIQAALLAHPSLGERLAPEVPRELVPGFITVPAPRTPRRGGPVRFLYSGSLDKARGIDLLLEALEQLPEEGWRLDITGLGPMNGVVEQTVLRPRWAGKVLFHHSVPTEEYNQLLADCDIGLNCQRALDPISSVTFPSKIFTYLSAGLVVISSLASDVEQICGNACRYFRHETPQALAATMKEVIEQFPAMPSGLDSSKVAQRYSIEGTVARLKPLLAKLGCPR